MKIPLLTSLVAATLTIAPHPAKADRDVKAFNQVVSVKDASSRILGARLGLCNLSLVNINGKIKYLTSLHCYTPNGEISAKDQETFDPRTKNKDIVLLDQLPLRVTTEDLSDAKIHNPSRFTPDTLGENPLTIKSKLPGKDASGRPVRTLFTIHGKAIKQKDGTMLMKIDEKTYTNMLDKANRQCEQGDYFLSGMSGGTVFDHEGNVFGVFSFVESLCSSERLKILWWTFDFFVDNRGRGNYFLGIVPLSQIYKTN